MPRADRRERVAIFGGGPSGLTAAYQLSRTPELRARYDVTIYQQGFRLGGKAASGRNLGASARIEEHGLHVLFGFYQNFFVMMRDVFDAVARPPDHPLATLHRAFLGHDHGVLAHRHGGQWHFASITAPHNDAAPGVGSALNKGAVMLADFARGILGIVFGWGRLRDDEERRRPLGAWSPEVERREAGSEDAWARALVRGLSRLFDLGGRGHRLAQARTPSLLRGLDRLGAAATQALARRAPTPQRQLFAQGVDFVLTMLRAVVKDGAFRRGGCVRLDEVDLTDWLRSHGLREDTVRSPYVEFIYHAAFSFEDGRPDRRRIAAGTTLRILARAFHTYKGALYYKMRSGMGDAVIAPLYEALLARGVRVRFFHELRALHLDERRSRVVAATVVRQARARGPDPDGYDPLILVKGVQCWPVAARWDALEDTPGLREVDLESYYSGWDGVETRTLREGEDFDRVILATPVATLPFVARELLDASQRWRDAVEHVRAVPTLSFQLWMKRDLRGLGWQRPPPLLSLYEEPLSTWCDMTHVLPAEDWTGPGTPRSLAYFTGAHEGPRDPPPRDDRGYPARCHAAAKREALAFLRTHAAALWPDATGPDGRALDFDLLVDPEGRSGEARFDAQYWRSNSEPSERCTLALPGSNKYRLRADDTGFVNLAVAGDWVDNGIYAACMEGATIGGILAARAVCGEPLRILGEELFELLPEPIQPAAGPFSPGPRRRATPPDATRERPAVTQPDLTRPSFSALRGGNRGGS